MKSHITSRLQSTSLGRAYIAARRAASRPSWWARDQADLVAIRVVIAAVLGRNGNAVDIGASDGSILDYIVKRSPAGRHYAFEPLPHRAAELRSRFQQVRVCEAAVTESNGRALLNHVIDDDWRSSLNDMSTHRDVTTIEVSTTRLDDALPPNYRVDLVKIDVEGAELRALDGAHETLTRHHPVVIVEHGGKAAPPGVLYGMVTSLGYEVFDLDGVGPYTADAMDSTMAADEKWNWLMVPTPRSQRCD